jgi:uncharacterized membrane protein YdjX (TVP38/TMEM64 family)
MAVSGETHGLAFWTKVAASPLAAIVGLVGLRLLARGALDQATLEAWVEPLGTLAPWVFVALLMVRPVSLLPGQVFTAVGGLLFGARWGTLYALMGSFLSSLLIFVLARPLGGRLIRRASGPRYPAVRELARAHGFHFALASCLNPLVPTDVAQALAAASGARFWAVALGVLLGTLPGTVLTATFGSALGQGKTALGVMSALGMIASLLLGVFFGRRALARWRALEAEAPG